MVAIYGAGLTGEWFFDIITKQEKIDCFIDKNKSGFKNGIKIYNSQGLYEEFVKQDLLSYPLITFINTLKIYPNIIQKFIDEKYLWLNGTLINQEKLQKVEKLLADKISLDYFKSWIKFRETLDIKYYPKPTNKLEDQYFPNNLDIGIINTMVDCGAYIGDTVELFYKYKQGTVISFEADKNNIEKFQNNMKSDYNIILYPMGVYSKTTILKFNSSGSSSSLSEDGDISIPVTSLDETLYNYKIDYIKMDIEGAEIDALNGARNIIKDFTPNLAISIYHKANDLWEIPLLINSINPNYNFYIRCHSNYMCIETVLYCVGKE